MKLNKQNFISKSLNCAEICRMNKDELFSTVGIYFQTYKQKENATFLIYSNLRCYNFQQLSLYFLNMQSVSYAYNIAHVKISIAQFSVKQIFEHIKEKHGKVEGQDQVISRLTALVVVFELLTANHDQPVLDLPAIARKALFVMYLDVLYFELIQKDGIQNSLLALLSSDMQRGVLTDFHPLADMIFLLDIIHSGNGSRRSSITVQKGCHWLTNFTSQFSKIYSIIQILTPATDLLFDQLFVKIHLIKTLNHVNIG
ncbi:hypothetical protein T10_174 [Trichinella papuae]|uniref:Uncharacterized protein n=1 Tax=Trichinella papuae TaxID=268474 RepID=A0A0V1M2P7_9BILA|nr:hypothetical protein T10_174 [Trichinella papuae]